MYWELERRICCAMAQHGLAAAWRAAAAAPQQQEQQEQQQPGQQQHQDQGQERGGAGPPHPSDAPPASLAPGFSPADALSAHEAKSFDYRLLHLLLHRLAGAPYDDALLAFMAADERLVDIGDDLTDYEDDGLGGGGSTPFRQLVCCFRCRLHRNKPSSVRGSGTWGMGSPARARRVGRRIGRGSGGFFAGL